MSESVRVSDYESEYDVYEKCENCGQFKITEVHNTTTTTDFNEKEAREIQAGQVALISLKAFGSGLLIAVGGAVCHVVFLIFLLLFLFGVGFWDGLRFTAFIGFVVGFLTDFFIEWGVKFPVKYKEAKRVTHYKRCRNCGFQFH